MADVAKQISIEPARPSDATTMATLSRDLIETGLSWSWRPARIAWQIGRDDTLATVARDGDDIVGYALTRFMDGYVRLNLLATVPSYRRRRIGQSLVHDAWRQALTAFCPTMHLEVRASNPAAIRFYHSLGFHSLVIIPNYYDNQEDAIHMYRTIDDVDIPQVSAR